MPFGTEVGLSPGDIVLNEAQLSRPQRGHAPPNFRTYLLWLNGRPSQLLLRSCTNGRPTIRNHREVVEKPLYKCTSEGMRHVAVWYHGIPGPISKVHEIQGMSFDWPDPRRCQISSSSHKKCA